MSASLRVHDEIVRSAITERGGFVFTTAGDAFCAAFQRASDAVAAAEAGQLALSIAEWPGPQLRVRMGIHLGEADERDGDYFGPVVNTAARVEAAGHGGQILVTDALRAAAGGEGIDLGSHRLRDIPEPVDLWQIGRGEFPPLRTAKTRSNLPQPATRLVGRDEDVTAVRDMLAEHRLVTLVAVGGVGKTRLAIEVAEAESGAWTDDVWFVDLTSVSADDEVAVTIASALGFEPRSGNIADGLAGYVGGRELLIVLDNCEHVIDACAEVVSGLLGAGGRSVVLATSREWLDIDGERVYQVRSLGAHGRGSPAVELFADRARAVAPGLVLSDEDWATVSLLCNRLDGMPLAIELAAARAAVMSPAMLLKGLDDRFRLLSGGRRRQRQRTLEAAIDWSYDLLDVDERRLFRALGSFVGSFDAVAVAEVAQIGQLDAIDLIEVLHARSLVSLADDSEGRFRLLETLKAYAEDRLVDEGEADAIRDRHAHHFAQRAAIASLTEGQNVNRAASQSLDMANLLLAADRLESQQRWPELAHHLFSVALHSGGTAAALLERIERCESHVAEPDLLDGLAHGELHCAMALADWGRYLGAAAKLRNSPNDASVGYGYLYLALLTGRADATQALAFIDRFADLASGSDDVGDETTLWTSMVAALSGDLTTASALAASIAGSAVGQTSFGFVAALISGVASWSHGDSAELTAFVERFEAAHGTGTKMDPGYATGLSFVRALVALCDQDPDVAEAAVREAALEAASGRFALVDGDALALLAELARREGDDQLARELILGTSVGRSPATIAATRHIAATLGIDDEVQANYRANLTDREWTITRPRLLLQRELDRRGWSTHPEEASEVRARTLSNRMSG